MDYVPLLFLGLAVVGGAIVLRYMIRLKRAAVQALEEARALESRIESLQAQTRSQDPAPRPDDPPWG